MGNVQKLRIKLIETSQEDHLFCVVFVYFFDCFNLLVFRFRQTCATSSAVNKRKSLRVKKFRKELGLSLGFRPEFKVSSD